MSISYIAGHLIISKSNIYRLNEIILLHSLDLQWICLRKALVYTNWQMSRCPLSSNPGISNGQGA